MPLEAHSTIHRRIEAGPELVRDGIEAAIDAWHGHWDRTTGNLEISVRAGVRRGRWRGHLDIAGDNTTTHLTLDSRGATYRVDQGSLVLLSIAGLSAIPLMLWPFFPRLLSLMPIALVLAVGGWFLVISRLQNQGPEGFLDTIEHLATQPAEPDPVGPDEEGV